MKYLLLIALALTLFLFSCSTDNRVEIAILTPVSHPSLEQAEKGFKEVIEARFPGKYRFTTYNAQGNKTLMRSELEEIAGKNYALLFAIGTGASYMAKEVFEKKQLEMPIVFTCVNTPVSGKNITGIKEELRFEEELLALLKLKPSIKSLLLVYNPREPGLQKDQQEVERLVQAKGLSLKTVEVFASNEIMAKTAPFMTEADALVVLKDNSVVSALSALVKLCEQHKVPLMASDLDSPDHGAAFGYGVYEIDFGREGAKKALQILEDGLKPSDIPVEPLLKFTLRINPEAAKRQGIQ